MTDDEPKTTLSGGGPVTPDHKELRCDGQQRGYIVLSEEERAKGYVRPFRDTYTHVGMRPKYPTRELTEQEHKDYDAFSYVLFEAYPESELPTTGRYWTRAQLDSGCGTNTKMAYDIAATYARDPQFYGGTFCVRCGKHLPLEEFRWVGTDEVVGS